MSVKAALLTRSRELSIVEVEEPAPSAGEVLIETLVGGICGSDIHTYLGRHPFRTPPVVLGHEAAGEVIALGDGVGDVAVGDLVTIEPQISCRVCHACRQGDPHLCVSARRPGAGSPGMFAERLVAPVETVCRLAQGVSAADAALVEPAAVAARAVRRARLEFGDSIAVIGAGSIGSLIVAAAGAAGAATVAVTDLHRFNRDFALRLGAQCAIDPVAQSLSERVSELTDGRGVEAVFVACSAKDALLEGVSAARRGGVVVQVALHEGELAFNATDAVLREVDVLSSLTYSADDFQKAVGLVETGIVSASRFVTRSYRLDDAGEAFRDIEGGLEHIKVQLCF